MRRNLTVLMMVAVTAAALLGAEAAKKPAAKKPAQPSPSLRPVEDVPGLPRVLLIGDSISMGYTVPTRELLKGVANVHRAPTNCGPSSKGVAEIAAWLGDGHWDVIHFNFGLHDLKYVDAKGSNSTPDKGHQNTTLEQYEKNLETIIAAMRKTGATLVFANTTPVPDQEPARKADAELPYNEVAERVMKKHNIPVDDLHTFAKAHQSEIQIPHNVHFHTDGCKQMAQLVADSVKAALQSRKAQ